MHRSTACLLSLLTIFVSNLIVSASDGTESLSLEAIFGTQLFRTKTPQKGKWQDGCFWYIGKDSVAGRKHLLKYDPETRRTEIIINGDTFTSSDNDSLLTLEDFRLGSTGRYILLFTDTRPLWRQNTLGYYYIFERSSGRCFALADRKKGLQMFAKFSPDDRQIVFVRNANLFLYDLDRKTEEILTTDGILPDRLNGITDWVYEEEFNLRDGWMWSPDGGTIIFYQFDTTPIREFIMTDERPRYPVTISLRYPLAGTENSNVRIGIIDLKNRSVRYISAGTWENQKVQFEYIPRIGWTPDGRIWLFRLNRHQNQLELLNYDPVSLQVSPVLIETSDTWIESSSIFNMGQRIRYLRGGKQFLWASDRDGYNHVYLYQSNGTLIKQITSGLFDLQKIDHVDEKNAFLYFTASIGNPVEKHLYRTRIDGAFKVEQISSGAGTHRSIVSPDGRYCYSEYETTGTPPACGVFDTAGNLVQMLEDNKHLDPLLKKFPVAAWEFDTLTARDGTLLYTFMIKPRNFDPSRKYPLLIYTYGGPTSQIVTNSWKGERGMWYTYLTDELPIIIAGIDNRGSSNRGKAFRAANYLNLGTVEPRDQIDAARKWGRLPYIDQDRVAIWGWSYGGINTLLSISKFDGPEIFKMGIAVAPVGSWDLYDTIYTERYLRTPQENPDGYFAASPVNFVDRLRPYQKLLLIHGDLDDNVHYQNTVRLIEALHRSNKAFHLMIYPGANHGMARTGIKTTKLHLYQTITNFLKEYL